VKDTQFAKVIVLVNSLVPLAILVWDFAHHQIGPNQSEYLLRTTGLLALIFLLLSLAVTPLRRITGKNYWSLFRRMLGLYAFFYACVHFLCYFIIDRSASLAAVYQDVLHRWFILLGMLALLVMIPLALTSTAASVKRLGNRRWKLLHKLVYLSLIAGTIHYLLVGKRVTMQPLAFAAIAAGLLLFRLVAFLRDRFLPQTPKNARPALAAK
jgi:DMSO/TMAO reductase YedYZ heme-binding membrane subunit